MAISRLENCLTLENKADCSSRELPERRCMGFMHSHLLKSDPILKVLRYIPLSQRSDFTPQRRYGAYRIHPV